MTTSSDATDKANANPVLIVDDDESIRQLIGDVLDREGIPSVLVGSANDAIEALGNHPVSLVLLDWGLQGGLDTSGAEVLDYCKERYPLLPMIVMSGMAIDVRTDATTKQADGFLAKPFNATVIVALVRQWLKRLQQTSKNSLPQRGEDIVPLQKQQGRYIRHVVQLLNNDISRAAEKLGVSPEAIEAILEQESAAG